MIFSLEFGKIFKRKFNYLFGMIILLISFLIIYKTSSLAGYYDLDEVDFIFKFTFKILLILIIFLMGINYIYSYREDYISKVSIFLELAKKKTLRDFSALVANLIYFATYYLIMLGGIILILFFTKKNKFLEIKNIIFSNVQNSIAYLSMVLLLLLLANLIFLFALTLFNNTNLAISLSLLYFIGGTVIAKMLEDRISFLSVRIENSILNIFDKEFNSLNQFIEFNLVTFLPISLNIVGLIIVIFIVKLIKKVI